MNNKVEFKHFIGSASDWNSKLNSDNWKDCIVFGKIWNIPDTMEDEPYCTYKICAGKSDIDIDPNKPYFVYEFPSFDDFDKLKQQIIDVSTKLEVDPNTGAFSNETFVNALGNSIEIYLSKSDIINNIHNDIDALDTSVLDHEVRLTDIEDNYVSDVDVSIKSESIAPKFLFANIDRSKGRRGYKIKINLDASIVDASPEWNHDAKGLVTDAYVDEKLAWDSIID